MEYSAILMLNYFEDTVANVGIPEAWLEWKFTDVTQIGKKYVKREFESNRVKTESIPVRNRESNQVRHHESIWDWSLGQCRTADANNGASIGYLSDIEVVTDLFQLLCC